MKKMICCTLVAAGIMLIGNAMVVSANIITTENDDNTFYVPAVGAWHTNSGHMNGMTVSVTFADSDDPLTGIWGFGVNGGASNTLVANAFQLYTTDPSGTPNVTGSTYAEVGFYLVNNGTSNITSVTITGFDGTTGSTVFDIESNPNSPYSTANSLEGIPLADSWQYWNPSLNSGAGGYQTQTGTVNYTSSLTITATYFNQIALNGSAGPVGDLYGGLRLDFAGSGFANGDIFWGMADTDNIDNNPVPEPATMLLFGLGISGILGRFVNSKKKIVS